MPKEPRTKEDWAAIDVKNRELTQQIKEMSTSYLDQSDIDFKNTLTETSEEQLKVLLNKMKSTRNFYRKIMQEPYYIEHPEKKFTHRFEDTEKKYKSVNSKGKIIYSLIQNSYPNDKRARSITNK